MKRTGPTNEHVRQLIGELHKASALEKTAVWKRVAEDLSKPTRQRRVVNIARINRVVKENEVIVVPGKVLGSGSLAHKVTVAALAFSDSAKERIAHAKGTCMTIQELLKSKPKGTHVRIIG